MLKKDYKNYALKSKINLFVVGISSVCSYF